MGFHELRQRRENEVELEKFVKEGVWVLREVIEREGILLNQLRFHNE